MNYREDINFAKPYREEYIKGINRIIFEREEAAKPKRQEFCSDIEKNPDKYREVLRCMLGWPLNEKMEKDIPDARFEMLSDAEEYRVFRVSFEVMEDLKLTGLLFRQKKNHRPLVIVQHGKLGTPEMLSGFYGDTYNYNNMTERIIKFGVHAFVPQLLLWDGEAAGSDFDREIIDARLKSLGSSAVAVEIYAMMRVLDYFEKEEDITNFGMIGMSYGGFYTLYLSALDKRLKSSLSCSYFNTHRKRTFCDWLWNDSAYKLQDAEVAYLTYPRKLHIATGVFDEGVNIDEARREYDRLLDLCKQDKAWVSFTEFEGNHEFIKDDLVIKKVIDEIME